MAQAPRPTTPPPRSAAPAHPAPSLPDTPLVKRPKMSSHAAPASAYPPGLALAIDHESSPHQETSPASHAISPAGIPLQVKLHHPSARAPTRGSRHAAGYDVYVCEDGVVPKWGKALLSTGISIAIPPGTYARIAPRSGLAAKHSLATGAGVIDFDYRGEVKLIVFNHSDADFKVTAGDRMAQLILERIVTPDVVVVDELEGTERGVGGFGSTGGFGAVVDADAAEVEKDKEGAEADVLPPADTEAMAEDPTAAELTAAVVGGF